MLTYIIGKPNNTWWTLFSVHCVPSIHNLHSYWTAGGSVLLSTGCQHISLQYASNSTIINDIKSIWLILYEVFRQEA